MPTANSDSDTKPTGPELTSLSIKQQLLLAQAVHQVQSSGKEKTIDWNRVTELLQKFLKSKENAIGFGGPFNPTVCSNVYSNLCQTCPDDQDTQAFDPARTLAIARKLYEAYVKSIAEALKETEEKRQKIQLEIEEISSGKWDNKLQSSSQSEQTTKPEKLSTPSSTLLDSSNQTNPAETEREDDLDAQTALNEKSSNRSSSGRSARNRSPNFQDRFFISKEPQEDSDKTEGAASHATDFAKGRKRKAPPAKHNQPEVIKAVDSPSSDDDAVFHQLTKAPDPASPSPARPPPTGPVLRKNRKLDSSSNQLSESLDADSSVSQSKKAKSQDDLNGSQTQEIPSTKRTRRTKSPSAEEEFITNRKRSEQGSESNQPSDKDAEDSPGEKAEAITSGEPESTAHSPCSNKKSIVETEISADGSHSGTPNSASFATSVAEGNSTTNQTPNSGQLTGFPTDSSSANTRQGSSSTGISDPTTFRRRMLKTHSSVQSNPISSIFRDPVKESEAPGYALIIKRPMDLRTLAKKLRDGKVTSTEEYRRDLMLMLANAVMFNHEDSEVTRHAKELMVECDRLVSIFMRGSRY